MAFYKGFERKTRQEKQKEAFARGGFQEEGYDRRGQSRGKSEGYRGDAYGKPGFQKKSDYRDKPGFQGKPDFRGKPGFQNKSDSYDKPGFQGKPDFRGKPGFHSKSDPYGKPGFQGKPDFRGKSGFQSKPDFLGKPGFQKKPDFRGKPGFQGKPDFRSKPGFQEKPGFRTEAVQRKPFPVKEQPPVPEHERYHYATPFDDAGDPVPPENLLTGRNPIREALKSGRDFEKLLVARGELSGSAREIVQTAKERRIPIQEVDRSRLDAIAPNHQGMIAFTSAYEYSTVEAMLELAKERGEEPFLILLDSITDPHNLGAIIRSAECAGAHGVIVQERRAVGLTPAAVKASAGAVEYLPVARVTNLSNTIEVLKAQNIWVYAADMEGESYDEADLSGAVALVIGSEGEGIGHHVLECCDKAISLPIKGHVDSLNASVAAGILMYAVAHARS